MTDKLKHTFAILAYQQSPYLEACIESLQCQSIESKIIIATSTPSRFLEKTAAKFGLPLLVNHGKKGIAADWTYAYNTCRTEFLTLAHQDDLYMPDYAKTCLSIMKSSPNCLIAFTDYIELFNNKIRDNNLLLNSKRMILFFFYQFKIKKNLSSCGIKKMMLSLGNPICCPSIMYHKKKIGNFAFDASLRMNLDWDASLKLSERKGDFIYIPKKLMIRRIHKESESTSALTTNVRQEEDSRLFERFWPKPVVKLIIKLYTLVYRSNG